jgi:hypothetical protein
MLAPPVEQLPAGLAPCPESTGGHATRPEVDRICREVLSEALAALARVDGIAAVLLAGSLAAGRACGTRVAGRPALLSDVDLVVVPGPTASPRLRRELVAHAARLNRGLLQRGLLSHLEFGVLQPRTLMQPDDRLFLHDLAAHGRTLAGDPSWLERLRSALRGRQPAPVEGERLVLNRLAGQLYMLPWFASADAQLRLVARYHFAKVYADHELGLRVLLGLAQAAAHPVLVRQAAARARWSSLREEDCATDPGSIAELCLAWRECLRDQVEAAAACAAVAVPRENRSWLRNLSSWASLPGCGRPWSERLGLKGSPLAIAHASAVAAAREVLEGPAVTRAWAENARGVVGLWRRAVAGTDDTPVTFVPDVLRFLGGDTP